MFNQSYFEMTSVIPVATFQSVEEAVKITSILYGEGMRIIEINLQHSCALDVIKTLKSKLPDDIIVGAGTVMVPELVELVHEAGADFGSSPGLTPELADKAKELKLDFLPGVATISEAMLAERMGFSHQKFFPAKASGGTDFLAAAANVLPGVRFCAAGGITPANASEFLSMPNVPVVSGTWLTPRNNDGEMDASAAATLARVASTFSL